MVFEVSAGAKAPFGGADRATSASPEGFSKGDEGPLEALKSVVCRYVNLARRSPDCAALLFGESEPGAADSETARRFELIAAHVRAAQAGGALKSGDAELIATLIVGAIAGAADLSQNGRVIAASGVSDLLSLPLFLIDRLTTKRCN